MSALKEALKRRRGQSVDLAVILGHGLDKGIMDKGMEEAPMTDDQPMDEPHAGVMHDAMADKEKEAAHKAVMMGPHEMAADEGADESMDDEKDLYDHMSGEMPDYDKEAMMSREKPRSLGERAKKALFSKHMKKG